VEKIWVAHQCKKLSETYGTTLGWYHFFFDILGQVLSPPKKHVAESAGKIWQTTWLMIAATNWGPFYDRNPLIRA